jgi:hypothetical protein
MDGIDLASELLAKELYGKFGSIRSQCGAMYE